MISASARAAQDDLASYDADDPMRTAENRSRPTLGVLAGWNVYGGSLDSFLAPALRGIQAAADRQGCNLLIACGMNTQPEIQTAWPTVRPDADFLPVGPWNTDGLIAILPLMMPWQVRYFEDLSDRGFPTIYAGAGLPGPAVSADNEGGIHQALMHMAWHGHKRIAFIAGRRNHGHGDSQRRHAAFQAGLAELELPSDPDLVAWGAHSEDGGREAMNRVLASGRPFTAVLASNDASAIGAIEALSAAGRRIPEDVAVIGFDDRLQAEAQTPPLTTIRYPTFELGYRALSLLLAYVRGELKTIPHQKVPTQLIIRNSCGCPVSGADGTVLSRGVAEAPLLVERLTQVVRNETHNLSFDEITAFCGELAAACPWVEPFPAHKAKSAYADTFLETLYRILAQVVDHGGNSNAWQGAITLLRDAATSHAEANPRSAHDIEEAWHRARMVISRAAQSQATRRALETAEVSNALGEMVASFFGAQEEAEIYQALDERLDSMGIRQAILAVYEADGDDPVAASVLWPRGPAADGRRFPTRSFPPPSLYDIEVPLSLALLPLASGDNLRGFIAFEGADLGPYAWVARQVSAALREVGLYREALEGRRLAEEANRLKSRFLSMVSHELRTPVNLITGLSDLLLNQSSNGDGLTDSREDIERIYTTAQHLDGLIRDVLDLASSEVNQLKLTYEPLDMVEVLNQAAAIGQQLARDKGLIWRAEIPSNLPPVWGDRTRLRQVVLNLVNNAVKFTNHGEVTLSGVAKDGELTVTVDDTGLGIPLDDKDVIFDEFGQSERTISRSCGGLGLGLAICKRLVEGHGGHIGFHSSGEEEGGSTFYFSIPVLAPPEESGAPAESGPSTDPEVPAAATDVERRTLLIVKDEAAGRRLQAYLAEDNTCVTLCAAEQLARRLREIVTIPPDVILLDQGVTADRGWELLKLLKGNPATSAIPVLFYSIAADTAIAGARGNLLDIDYMTKPMGSAALADALARRGLLPRQATTEAVRRILIVDDDPGMLAMHASVVSGQSPDYEVVTATDGHEALEMIQRLRPDLVLLDLMMPKLDGFGVLESMRDTDIGREIPVVVLTGKSLSDEDMQRLNHGMASVLAKGIFSADETLAHIKAALSCALKPASEARRIVLTAMAYIHAQYGASISREDIAQHVSVSSRHLNRCFRQELGISPITYLNRYRIRQAKALLQRGEQSVTAIGLQVGFSSSSYFTRIFKDELGVSPRAYQQGERAEPQRPSAD